MRFRVRDLTRAAMLLALALVVQALVKYQLVTGSVVNAVLLLAAALVGPWWGVMIGLVTPWVAALSGILPAPVIPFVPFIMAANAILCGAFAGLNRRNRWLAALAAALAKFLWLSVSVRYLADLFHIALPLKVAAMFQLPQLYTALIGGAVAVVMLSVPGFRHLADRDSARG